MQEKRAGHALTLNTVAAVQTSRSSMGRWKRGLFDQQIRL